MHELLGGISAEASGVVAVGDFVVSINGQSVIGLDAMEIARSVDWLTPPADIGFLRSLHGPSVATVS